MLLLGLFGVSCVSPRSAGSLIDSRVLGITRAILVFFKDHHLFCGARSVCVCCVGAADACPATARGVHPVGGVARRRRGFVSVRCGRGGLPWWSTPDHGLRLVCDVRFS